MRKFIVPVLIALLAVAPVASFAATTPASTEGEQSLAGTVKLINLIGRSVELDDGSWFYLPLDLKLPDVKVGDKVNIQWKMNGTAHDVTSLSLG